MAQRVMGHPKIEVCWDTVVEEVLGDGTVSGVLIRNLKTDLVAEFPTEGVFVAIGHEPNTSLFKGLLTLNEEGYLETFGNTASSIPGVFGAGDVVDFTYRQAITAAGSGCQAAIDAERWLDNQE